VSTSSKEAAAAATDYRIAEKSPWAGAWKIVGGIGVLGLAAAAYGYTLDHERFAYSYLFGLFIPLSLALGALFFVMVMYITKAVWGVTVRRVAEMFMRPMPIFAVLMIPLVLLLPHLFPWLGAKRAEPMTMQGDATAEHAKESPAPEARGDETKEPAAVRDLPYANAKRVEAAEKREERKIVDHKGIYLDKRFFLGRLIAYLLIWYWLSYRFFRWSTEQDKTKAIENTAAAQQFAPAGLVLFGVTVTFFAFDWFLSLNATWYSTMFGVQVFAQMALFHMACLILMVLALRRSGIMGSAVNVEHFHDLGKLLFGWIAFWSYVTFAQFFLTWYSNIPDEVAWFHQRWHDNGGTWKSTSLLLVVMHFFVPFWFLMSRNIKRRLPLLGIGAACMFVMHIIEVYWIVMPNIGPLAPNFVDAACLVGLLGIYLSAVLRGMEDFALVPVGDPRLERALQFENA
jgi:hypothetical protein